MLIAIPSKARVTRQITLASLPPSIRQAVHIVVDCDDVEAYTVLGHPLIIMPPFARGAGAARQAAVDFALSRGIHKLLMLDDDLTFAKRRIDAPTKFTTATDESVIRVIEEVGIKLNGAAHVAISPREGGNRRTESYIRNTRALRALAFRTDVLQTHKIRFDEFGVMEDFNVQLQLLLLGYEHLSINWMVQNQGGSNTAGGASTHRTMEVQAQAATALAVKFPKYVRLVRKQTKVAWGGQERLDVVISWKEAYEDGIANARSGTHQATISLD